MVLPPPKCGEIGAFYPVFERLELSAAERHTTERGLEISTLAVVDVTRRCAFTLAVAQTPPGDDETVSPQAKEATRVDFYRQQLREQRHRLPPQVTYHCVDGYYAKKKYIDEAVRLDLHPITKLRCDADCRFLYTGPHPKRRGARRKYES